MTGVVFLASITAPEPAAGAVVVSGSHGGALPGQLAVAKGPRGVILHDAGIGLAGAGVAGLEILANAGIPAACVSHRTARIGDPSDMMAHGLLSVVNEPAAALGLVVGMAVGEAVQQLAAGLDPVGASAATPPEWRHVLRSPRGGRPLVLADSASLIEPATDAGAVVVTGSHGGLVGGDRSYGLKAAAFAAVFNDAGGGIDDAGFQRLSILDDAGVAAVTVSAESARIGDATSSLAGLVSRVNPRAAALGVQVGEPVAPAIYSWIGA